METCQLPHLPQSRACWVMCSSCGTPRELGDWCRTVQPTLSINVASSITSCLKSFCPVTTLPTLPTLRLAAEASRGVYRPNVC